MKNLYLLASLVAMLCPVALSAQDYYLGSAPAVTTCTGRFYDDAPNANYANNQNTVMTFCSATNDSAVYLQFQQFHIEAGFDILTIYNGPDTLAPVLGTYSGNLEPFSVVSSNPNHCLTVRFVSDLSISNLGWRALVGCGTPIPQGPPITTVCETALPFCSSINYNLIAATGTIAHLGPNYDCLLTQPNPVWFSIPIVQSGSLNVAISSTNGVDVDFILWGPVSATAPCSNLTGANVVDCSYSAGANEQANIPNAQAGQTYMLCVTNYSNQPTDLVISTMPNSTARTDCNQSCAVGISQLHMANCTGADSIYVSAGLYMVSQADTGTITIANNYGDTLVLSAPFPQSFTFNAYIPTSSDSLRISAVLSFDTVCGFARSYAVVVNNLSATASVQLTAGIGQATGSASLNISGGIPPYTILWSNNASTSSITSLVAGTYSYTITDALGCSIHDTVLVEAIPCQLSLVTNAVYCQAGGSVYFADIYYAIQGAPTQGDLVLMVNEVNAFYVSPPYNANNFNYTTPAFNGTGPVYVRAFFASDTSCAVTDTAATVIQPVSANLVVTDATGSNSNGQISATVASGLSPYTFAWSNGGTQSTIQNLAPGGYQVTITDARGCSITVAAGVSGIVGIKQPDSGAQISIMPNPATDAVQVQFGTHVNATGYIYGTDGKLYNSFAINGTTETVNIAQLPKGVYIIHVKDSATNATCYSRLLKY